MTLLNTKEKYKLKRKCFQRYKCILIFFSYTLVACLAHHWVSACKSVIFGTML